MYRLLLIAGLLILLYFLIRSVIRELSGRRDTGGGPLMEDRNKMVQDPVCKVFVPRGTAVTAEIGGQTYFFCSRDCAQTFQKQLSG
jgi:YHS domain-containing protein